MPKNDIHPKYFEEAQFICTTCANKFICGTTKGEEVRVDICSNCHPFFTKKAENEKNAEKEAK